ncbi:MAG: hypothetical protein WD359_07505 [Dehalococcoidia bacterium]
MATQTMRNADAPKDRKASPEPRHEVKVRAAFIRLPRRGNSMRQDGRVA